MSMGTIHVQYFEIALLGQNRIDYTNSNARCSLRAMPGMKWTGLQLMCLMHVCWQEINPTLKVGLDLAKEYAMAKELVADGK